MDHPAKPVKVQGAQNGHACHICYREPRRHWQLSGILYGSPHVLVHSEGLVVSPDQSTAAKGCNQSDAVVPLELTACPAQFVEEPVDVDKGGRQFVENEVKTVVVEERALSSVSR